MEAKKAVHPYFDSCLCFEALLSRKKGLSRGTVFHARMQFNDSLFESYRAKKKALDNLLEGDRGLLEIGCKGESSIPNGSRSRA